MLSKTINGKEYLFVEIEKASSEFWLDKGELHYLWGEDYVTIQLPTKTKMKIIGKASELTDEQWKGIVEVFNNGAYRDYGQSLFAPDMSTDVFCLTAKESGLSLIASLNLKPETTLIIQKLC
jgi:hypothetical protein